MKIMLHFSIALMLIAGVAGATDFTQMFRTGEIDKLYEENTSGKAGDLKAPEALPALAHFASKVRFVQIEDFSRAPLIEEEITPVNEEELVVASAVSEPTAESEMAASGIGERQSEAVVSAISSEAVKDPVNAEATDDMKASIADSATIVEDISRDFTWERFSRAPLPQKKIVKLSLKKEAKEDKSEATQ